MKWPIVTSGIDREADVVTVRQRTHQIAGLLGFEITDQTRIATAASELARNAFSYAGGGRAEFHVESQAGVQTLVIRITDRGRFENLDEVLSGRYRSPHGMGLGIVGARRLMDRFEAVTGPKGTVITLGKRLPSGARRVTREVVAEITGVLATAAPVDPLAVLHDQQRELLHSFDELRARQEEILRLNAELEDTNRGVVALYAELEDKAEQLRQASELKSRFLSNMSHEFRTPLSSILALSRLLLERADGELSEEQERQVTFIRESARTIHAMVDDLLDLAKVEAGKTDIRPTLISAGELLGGLRGSLKPLQGTGAAELVFEDPATDVALYSDQGKLAQIMRNLVSNALKFTERGEVRVSVAYDRVADMVLFEVADTGIGIEPEHVEKIFEEFSQIDSKLQRGVRGTGLGLPLSRRLAELLGGTLTVTSEVGKGSRFLLKVPSWWALRLDGLELRPRRTALVIDNDASFRYFVRQQLESLGLAVEEAEDGIQGLDRLLAAGPDLALLDLSMPGLDGYGVLEGAAELATPIVVSTDAPLGAEEQARLALARALLSKQSVTRDLLAMLLDRFSRPPAA